MKKVKRMAKGGSSIDDDVRARALASVANLDKADDSPAGKSGYGEENDIPEVAKKAVKKAAAKLPMPDYSNEDLDRMGMNNDIKPVKKFTPSGRSPGRMLREESEFTIKPPLQEKGERLMKGANLNFKSGGAVRKSASSRADGIAIRGKTRA